MRNRPRPTRAELSKRSVDGSGVVATGENVRYPPARAEPPPRVEMETVLAAPEALRSVMSRIPIVMILVDSNGTTTTEFAQEYVSVGLSVLGNENVTTYPFQVSTIVVLEENDTLGAVGKDPQMPMHVKIGVYESAWALGAPMATNRTVTVMMVHNDFRISETFLNVSSVFNSHPTNPDFKP